jgi:hypothetical protein
MLMQIQLILTAADHYSLKNEVLHNNFDQELFS